MLSHDIVTRRVFHTEVLAGCGYFSEFLRIIIIMIIIIYHCHFTASILLSSTLGIELFLAERGFLFLQNKTKKKRINLCAILLQLCYTSYYRTRGSMVLCGSYIYLPVAVYYNNIMIVGFTEHALVYRDNILLLLC